MTKKIVSIALALLLCLAISVTAFAAGAPRLYDGADLLTAAEESALQSRLDSASAQYQVEFVVALVDTTGGITADEYISRYYDENSFGLGQRRDGVMLLVAMEERDYRILSNGLGADAVTLDEIDRIGDNVASYLSDGDYAEAVQTFIDDCVYEIDGEINGFPFAFTTNLGIALVIGFIVAFIATGIMKGKLKSVRRQYAAAEYTKVGSLQITNSNEFFLYKNVIMTKRQQESSSSGRSSGGSSRNVGGGKF